MEKLSNILLMILITGAVSLAGCGTPITGAALPQRRSLGYDYTTFTAPEETTQLDSEVRENPNPQGDITLNEALQLSLLHNPRLRAFAWEIRAAEARQLQANLLPNPEIEFEIEEIGGSGQRSRFNGTESSIQLSQVVELGDKRSQRNQLASLNAHLTGWDYEAQRLDVFTEVAHAFVDVLAAQERLALAQESVLIHEEVLKSIKEKVAAGKDSPVEAMKAEVELSSARTGLTKARQSLDYNRKKLALMWGSQEATFQQVKGSLHDQVWAVPVEDEIRELVTQNPDLARWNMELQQRRSELALEKANAIGDPVLSGGVQQFNEDDDIAFVLGLSFPLPLFDRNQAGILEAKYNILKAREQQRVIESLVQAALSKAYLFLANAYTEATDLQNTILPIAEKSFDAVRQGYSTGKFDYLEVLDSQRTLFEEKGKLIEALAEYHRARADVERLIGQSLSDIGTETEMR